LIHRKALATASTVLAGQMIMPLPTIRAWCARAAALLLAGFAVFQTLLALGASFARFTWGGSTAVLSAPMRAASAGAGLLLFAFVGVMLVRSGDLGRRLPPRAFWWLNLLVAVQLSLNTVANMMSREAGERVIMGTASALGCLFCIGALVPTALPRSGAAKKVATRN
jgi:hypothetical protein